MEIRLHRKLAHHNEFPHRTSLQATTTRRLRPPPNLLPPHRSLLLCTPAPSPIDISTQVSHSVFLAKSGIRGLVLLGSTGEAIYTVTGMRTLEGSRLPLKWNMGEGEWEKWSICMERMEKLEDSLA
jgi:hypothetical protein